MFYQLKDANIVGITPAEQMNGAGPRGWSWIVPDQIGMVNITQAANIHDAHYYYISLVKLNKDRPTVRKAMQHLKSNGLDSFVAMLQMSGIEFARRYADNCFWENMNRLNKAAGGGVIRQQIRKSALWIYWRMTRNFGWRFLA